MISIRVIHLLLQYFLIIYGNGHVTYYIASCGTRNEPAQATLHQLKRIPKDNDFFNDLQRCLKM